jgi:ribosomal protein S18 acetylase RimI-like enzyme
LSRLLRSLEAQGLVTLGASEADRRTRVARLTARGRRERGAYDRLSDRLAASILDPLDEAQRTRLTEAMAVVERLLLASAVTIAPEDPATPEARWCLESYFADLGARFSGGFDPALSIPAEDADLRLPGGLLLVARLREEPVGCGALKRGRGGIWEVKRMWVAPEARGLGLGRRILRELERHAARLRARALRLETNGTLAEAIALYRSAGYEEVAAFNDEPYAHHWFEKRIRPAPRG